MLDAIVAGLILAAVSGIAFLAYKHPSAYKTLYTPGILVINAVAVLVSGYALGIQTGFWIVKPYLAGDKVTVAEETVAHFMPSGWIVGGVVLAANLYFGFLAHLPKLLKEGKDARPD